MITEIWKPVFGYEGLYEVSNLGRVKSIIPFKGAQERIRSLSKDRDGYNQVVLWRHGTAKVKKVYILVLEAYICPRPIEMVGCHNDGSKDNDHLDNLRWGTPSDNEQDKKIHGTHNCGVRNGSVKLTEKDVRNIKILLSNGFSQTSIARQFGVTQANISLINCGKKWNTLKT